MVIAWFCCRISNLWFLQKLFISCTLKEFSRSIEHKHLFNWIYHHHKLTICVRFYFIFVECSAKFIKSRKEDVFVHWKCFNLRDKLWLQRSGCIWRLKTFALREKILKLWQSSLMKFLVQKCKDRAECFAIQYHDEKIRLIDVQSFLLKKVSGESATL